MTEEAKQKTRKLEGEAALDLWRQGPSVWNRWIAQHPGWNISFAGVDFSHERGANGKLSFEWYHFGGGDVDFTDTIFGNGDVSFRQVIFGDGDVSFFRADFRDGEVVFSDASFGDGSLHFYETTFSNCEVYFYRTTFGDVKILFGHTQIKNLYFNPAVIRSSLFEAEQLSIKGQAVFSFPYLANRLQSFDLYSASFDGPLTLTGDINIIPDLRATRYSHQVDLSDLNVKLPRISPTLGWPQKLSLVAKDPKDASRLRRLKEIAETNKDHQAALRFSADENRAKRWIETSWFGSVLDMAFSAFSDYGQNILRPFMALIALTVTSMGLYKTLATETSADGWTGWVEAFILSASNSLPFLPQSRDLREDALKALYGTDPGLCVDILMITQGVLSFVFLFLIGLGLRNRFRL